MAMKPGNGGGGNGERDPRLDLLYRDTPRATPPPHLDAAIMAAARREVGARPRAFSLPLRRWRVPVSIAAIVVLSVSLVTLVSEEGGESLLRDERLPAAPPVARKVESPEQPADPAKAPEARQRMPTTAPEAFSLRLDEGQAKATAVPRSATERDVRSSAEPAAKPDTGAAPQAGVVGGLFSNQLGESPVRAEADTAQRPAPSAGVRGSSAADTAPRAAAPQPKPIAENRQYTEHARARLEKRPPVWQGLEREPPQKWLERLADLRKQGRTGEADELLAELKRRFPNYPLPSGLE
jgi:hypothetical protein